MNIWPKNNEKDPYAVARKKMVEEQIKARGVKDKRTLNAMWETPRHLFMDEDNWERAYADHPLPIGKGQTVSQPYMVALMTELLELKGDERVLEIGTGSGYQSAVLSRLAKKVYTIERVESLASSAKKVLDSLGICNVSFKVADGTLGWEQEAPFDGIIVTAGSPETPECYLEQLNENGRLVIPVGDDYSQTLYLFRKRGEKIEKDRITSCVFVKLIGKHGWSC